MSQDHFDDVRARLRDFVAARDWGQFHTPKNLAMAVASEAGELLSELRWVSGDESDTFVRAPANRERVEGEAADVAIALLLFCDRAEIDLLSAMDRKIDVNAKNYPVKSTRGKAERPG